MLKDNFTVKINLKGYNIFNKDKTLILNFEEASIEETLDFLEKIERGDFQIIELIYKIFEKASKWKINKRIFSKYIANNLETILEILKKTYIKWVFAKEKQEKEEKKEEKPNKIDTEEFLKDFGRLLAFLTEKMAIDPNSLLKNYTWRQITFWTKHYLYNERSKTEEGQKENKKEENREYVEKNKTEIDKSIKAIEKYLNKKS